MSGCSSRYEWQPPACGWTLKPASSRRCIKFRLPLVTTAEMVGATHRDGCGITAYITLEHAEAIVAPPIGSTSTAAKSNRSWQLCVPSLHRTTCRWVAAVAAQGCHRAGTAAATSSVRPRQGRPPGGLRAPANELADPRSGRERAPTAGSPVPGGVQLLPGRSRYRRARPWSAMLGRYDNWSATRCARCAEFGVTEALPLITGDTVASRHARPFATLVIFGRPTLRVKPHPDSPGCSPTTPSCQVLPPGVPGNAYLCQ